MEKLNLPAFDFKVKHEGQRTQIFDGIRKKYVVLTPEEWVRQHYIQYLVTEKNIPASLIAVEMGIKYNKMQKRCDVVIHNRSGQPLMIVECKAPGIKITQDTFDQAAMYNVTLRVEYLVVTNGLFHYYSKIDFEKSTYHFLEELPDFEMING